MSNIQKSFKQKAMRSLRGFSLGGVPGANSPQKPSVSDSGGVGILKDSVTDDWNAGFDARRLAEQENTPWDGTGMDGVRRPELAASAALAPKRSAALAPKRSAAPDNWRPMPAFEFGGSIRSLFGSKPSPAAPAAPVDDPVARAQAALAASQAKYGGAPVQAPSPARPAPAQTAAPAPTIQGAVQSLRGRAAQIDAAAGYAHGGEIKPFVDGAGFIHGAPGVDKVPAQVEETGEPIRVGSGERIVNQKQNKALEHLAQKTTGQPLDDYLEGATGQPVGPKMKQGIRAAANGFFNGVGDAMANMVKSPDRRAMDSGVATPEQVAREEHGMQRAFATDSPYDVALPMAPMTGLRAAAPKASGIVDSAMSAAKNAVGSVASSAGDAVRGLRGMVSKKAAAPAAEAADNIAPIVAPEKWSREATEHLAQRTAQDKAFASPASVGKAVPTAGKELAAAPAVNAVLQSTAGRPPTAASTAPTLPQEADKPADDANIRGLRSAGVEGEAGVSPEVRRDAAERAYYATPAKGIRTLDTTNGKVYAGRDGDGQLNVVSNAGQSAEDAEAARAAEAARMSADMKRQTETFDRLAIERDMKSNNPADRESAEKRMGLRTLDAQIAQSNLANETTRRGQDLTLQAHQIDNQTKLATLKNQQRTQRAENVLKQIDNEFGPSMLKDGVPNMERRKFESDLRNTLGEVGFDVGDLSPRDMQEFKVAYEAAQRLEPSAARKLYMNWVQGRPFVRDSNPHRQVSRAAGEAGKTNSLRTYQTSNGWDAYAPSAVDSSFFTGEHDLNARRYLDK